MSYTIDDRVDEALSADVAAGQAQYSQGFLQWYDLLVLKINTRVLWRCPAPRMLDWYNRHMSAAHLDVGVGTGYFLDKCRFPTAEPRLALVDLNPNTLIHVRTRLSRYRDVFLYRRNVLRPLELDGSFDSIGINYLLHCLPGAVEHKAGVVFENLAAHLSQGGVVFGATLLQDRATAYPLSALAMRRYQRRRIFANEQDTEAGLRRALADHFRTYELIGLGCAALFQGRR